MKSRSPLVFCAALALLVVASVSVQAQVKVDPKLPSYRPVPGVSGSINSVGSDTMNNMMTLWSEGFLRYYPSVRIEIEGKGSSTAPPALIAGKANFGPMSRQMKSSEQDAFEAKFGYKCTQLGTSIDMLAVFANKDNPITGLTLKQADSIFSSTRKRGGDDITKWGQLGLTGQWSSAAITIYGRNSASGTYGYFKKNVMLEGDYRPSVNEQPGSSAVVARVAGDKNGIGYSGIGYKTADVKALALGESADKLIPATAEYAYTGDYPLARFLWLSVNYEPGTQLDPLRREFLKFVFSKQGQEIVIKDGYFPVNAKTAAKQLSLVGIKMAGAE